MGIIKHIDPVKLFIGVTFKKDINLELLEKKMVERWGEIDERSSVFDFSSHTKYYEKEMGHSLLKYWLVFRKLIDPAVLPEIKIHTNNIEQMFSKDNSFRDINLDPGYITAANLILATTKNYSHRIYMDKGIFGDLHLMFQNKKFNRMPWTYPDYFENKHLKFFESVRNRYMEQLRES